MAVHEHLLGHSSTPNKSRACSTLAIFLSLVAIAISFTALFLTNYHTTNITTLSNTSQYEYSSLSHLCEPAQNPKSCLTLLSQELSVATPHSDNVRLLGLFLNNSISPTFHAMKLVERVQTSMANYNNNAREQSVLNTCIELLGSSMDKILNSEYTLRVTPPQYLSKAFSDAHTWLSAVIANHATCLDGLIEGRPSHSVMKPELEGLKARASAALSMIVASSSSFDVDDFPLRPLKGDLPPWVTPSDRRLLALGAKGITADVTVAQDGTGKYKKIQDALDAAPKNSNKRYVVYVKKGTYKETVRVQDKKNIMIVGDGMTSTIITGHLTNSDVGTYDSATLASNSDYFIAQDLCIQNTAGPKGEQAVALRVNGDFSVINRCNLDAYQDTLYQHSQRQFYSDCTVTGTVDFIFGTAPVVMQKCTIIPRKPLDGQQNTITAQGKNDKNQKSATSIQQCTIQASDDLKPVMSKYQSYLGRPWQKYATTVYMQSNIGKVIDPAGWLEWKGQDNLKTLYYGEYANYGDGAGTSKRVNWPGYHVITDYKVALQFTVNELIDGAQWLAATGVNYIPGL
ncbi:hypothetical protein Sjap_025287 [Stephania japonica]|uniref:Pectinesterase n=1 Tax=Stephania japonica TaxID=461633 RepID=A0AAP0E1J0_9MAGN